MDTIEVTYMLGDDKACIVYRDGAELFAYDIWNGMYILMNIHRRDLAAFKVKEVKDV